MGCIIPFLGLLAPRLILFVLFLCTNYFSKAYETAIWPILGFIFMPFTTFAYLWASIETNRCVTGGWIVVIVIAVILDLGNSGRAACKNL
jgi:hypothetical protein